MIDAKEPESRSLSGAVEILRRKGYLHDFVSSQGKLRCSQSGELFDPEELRIVDHLRFEGSSDPDEMAIVYAVETQSGRKGVIIDAFGLYSDPLLAQLLDRMPTPSKISEASH